MQKILNRFGYYKISQLAVGGFCGTCGKSMPRNIFIKDWHWGICDDCKNTRESELNNLCPHGYKDWDDCPDCCH